MPHPMLCRLALFFALVGPPALLAESEAPCYTNADLERVRPLRDQTGVASVPAVSPADEEHDSSAARRRGRGARSQQRRNEAYWRREAARHRKRQEALVDKAERVRRQIAAEKIRRRTSLHMRDRAILERLEERLEAIERRRMEEEDRFFERARRAGALPGWLR